MFTEKQKIDRGYFLFESERKAKKEKMEKMKGKVCKNEKEIVEISAGSDATTTVADENFKSNYLTCLLFFICF